MAKRKKVQGHLRHLEKKEKEWEKLCMHCGGCCGAYDDPCLYLKKDKKDKKDKFYCKIYIGRFGLRNSLKGEEFNCVPVKEILSTHWKKDYLCVYKKFSKQGWLRPKE